MTWLILLRWVMFYFFCIAHWLHLFICWEELGGDSMTWPLWRLQQYYRHAILWCGCCERRSNTTGMPFYDVATANAAAILQACHSLPLLLLTWTTYFWESHRTGITGSHGTSAFRFWGTSKLTFMVTELIHICTGNTIVFLFILSHPQRNLLLLLSCWYELKKKST